MYKIMHKSGELVGYAETPTAVNEMIKNKLLKLIKEYTYFDDNTAKIMAELPVSTPYFCYLDNFEVYDE